MTIQGNAGQLSVASASSFARTQLVGLAARTDSDMLFSYRWTSPSAIAYFSVFTRGSGGWRNAYRPRSGYGLEFASNSSTVVLMKTVDGTASALAATNGAQQVGTAVQWVRLRVSGATIQYRTWLDGRAEPTGWRVSVTDSSVTAAGQLFLSLNPGSTNVGAKAVLLDGLTVYPTG